MKALIIFGSPRKNGDCASLVKTFVQNFDGQVDYVCVFPNVDKSGKGILPCINCKACKKVPCVLKDDFFKILADDYDVLLLASPIYFSNLPGPMLNVISRFNYFYHSKNKLQKAKTGVLFLTGGGHTVKRMQGKSNEDLALRQAEYIFFKTNSTLAEENTIVLLNTDEVSAKNNPDAQAKAKEIAHRLSKKD